MPRFVDHSSYSTASYQSPRLKTPLSCPCRSIVKLQDEPDLQTSSHPAKHLVSIPRRVILRADDQTPPLLRAAINRLDNINQLLLILEHPIQLVVVSRAEIAHHVLVAEEEHDRARVVELVHGLEVWDFVEVAHVQGCEVLHPVGNLVQHFVLPHAVRV